MQQKDQTRLAPVRSRFVGCEFIVHPVSCSSKVSIVKKNAQCHHISCKIGSGRLWYEAGLAVILELMHGDTPTADMFLLNWTMENYGVKRWMKNRIKTAQ
jgi:hypothetical protein